MKSLIFYIVSLFLLTESIAQGSRVFDDLTINSSILKKTKKFSLYLPPGYDSTNRNYPVLYLLHGGGDDQEAWLEKGNMQHIADSAIASGMAAPMIIVMPDAERTYYMNAANGSYQFEDFFIKELVPYIEKNYRCRGEKNYRALAGLSMGGFGSLLYSMHYPDMFVACAALSAAVRTDQEILDMPLADYLGRFQIPMGELKEGAERLTPFWKENNILDIVNSMPEKQKSKVRFYLEIGDADFLSKGNAWLHIAMIEKRIPHEYRVRKGAHNWQFWQSGLPAALQFISESFRR